MLKWLANNGGMPLIIIAFTGLCVSTAVSCISCNNEITQARQCQKMCWTECDSFDVKGYATSEACYCQCANGGIRHLKY
jgi:hypothetical protein